jgi:hypothetical protein
MHFQVEKQTRGLPGEPGYRAPLFSWRLIAASGALCRSVDGFQSLALARGNIADFKRSASGARFAKVVDPQDA